MSTIVFTESRQIYPHADSHRGCAYDSTWGTFRLPDRLLLPPPGKRILATSLRVV